MMARQDGVGDLWSRNMAAISRFVERESNTPALLLDPAGLVLHCNRALLKMLHLAEVPRHLPVTSLLAAETGKGLAWEQQNAYRLEIWHWKVPVGYYRAECHIYASDGGWLVFVDKPLLTDSSFIREFDEINRELSAMSRELHKKNAALEAAHRNLMEKETILRQAAEMSQIGHWQWTGSTDAIQVSGNLCRLWGEGFQDRTIKEGDFYRHLCPEDLTEFAHWLATVKETGQAGEMEFRYYGPTGQARFGFCRVDVLCDVKSRQMTLIGVIQDITGRKLYEQEIERIAFYDALTGLPNRKLFEDFFDKEKARAQREAATIAILLMDLDGFKRVNDTLGHDAGDFVLQTVARRMKESVRGGDTVARLGGDEFIAYLGRLPDEQEALAVARRILCACNEPIQYAGQQTGVGVSIGISFFPADAESLEKLMKQADSAMYLAKQHNKNDIRCYRDITEKTMNPERNGKQ